MALRSDARWLGRHRESEGVELEYRRYPVKSPPHLLKAQYIVVNPPPRYEIVGLLQQRSYTPVNEFFGNLTRGAARIACWEAAREGSQSIADRKRSRHWPEGVAGGGPGGGPRGSRIGPEGAGRRPSARAAQTADDCRAGGDVGASLQSKPWPPHRRSPLPST